MLVCGLLSSQSVPENEKDSVIFFATAPAVFSSPPLPPILSSVPPIYLPLISLPLVEFKLRVELEGITF